MTIDTIYDHPSYYDILFGWDRSAEADFYERVFALAPIGSDEPVLEVACGTGQIARRLARSTRPVWGMDVNPAMLAFLRERAAAEGVTVRTLRADMTSFSHDVRFGAAINPMSSFRLLDSDARAEAHLAAMARALRPGGVYALDLELTPSLDAPLPTTDTAWEMGRGGVTVRATNAAIHVDDDGSSRVLAWGAEGHLRTYTAATFADRVAAAGGFRIEAWHPEVARAAEDGISVFDADAPARTLRAGRAMVVLRRA